MRFRPCIDIHNGRVKQIVGMSLRDQEDQAKENFVSDKDAAYYAGLYASYGLSGGHVIMLNPKDSDHYRKNREQAILALKAYPGGMMAGGGIDPDNAAGFLEAGASHVIVTSYVFRGGRIDMEALKEIRAAVGREHLCLDLSCRRSDGKLFIVTDRWQSFTDEEFGSPLLEELADYASEYLVHAVDAEGLRQGIDEDVLTILQTSPIPATYAGGVQSLEDIRRIKRAGGDAVDVTVGSALDLFGGSLSMEEIMACIS